MRAGADERVFRVQAERLGHAESHQRTPSLLVTVTPQLYGCMMSAVGCEEFKRATVATIYNILFIVISGEEALGFE